MQRIVKILIVASFTLPFGFSPLVLIAGFDAYYSVLLTMSFSAFIPLVFVLYMYDTILCMGGFKKYEKPLLRQMLVASGFIIVGGAILWFSHTSIVNADLALKDRGLIFVLSFMLFGAVLNNVADQKLA